MKTRKTLLFALSGVLVLCAALYFGLRWWNSRADAAQAESQTYVAQLSDLTGLAFQRGNTTLEFSRGGDGVWYAASDPDFPVKQNLLSTLETTLSKLVPVKTISDPEADNSYGLDAPSLKLTAESSSGAVFSLDVGSEVGGNYYARVEGEKTVYTISSSLMDQTDYSLTGMIELDAIPPVTESRLLSLTISSGGKTSVFTKETVTTGEGDTAVKSYVWSRDGAALSKDDALLASALSALPGLSFTSCSAWRPDAAILGACGMNSPASITAAYEGGSYTLLLGGTDANGYYYAKLDGSNQLNLMYADAPTALLALLAG